jgi:hypothetical protein
MVIKTEKYTFYLGVDENDLELSTLHAKMIEDFRDASKLEYFKQLLDADPNTAFTIYNNL